MTSAATGARYSASYRIAGRMLLVSAPVAAVAVVLFVAMYASFAVGATSAALVFGSINDALTPVAYALAIPSVLAFSSILRPHAPTAAAALAGLGIVAMIAIIVLQVLLVSGLLTFEQQIGPVSIAFLAAGAWFILVGHLADAAGYLPHGARIGLVAGTYVGYPVWALTVGRRFLG